MQGFEDFLVSCSACFARRSVCLYAVYATTCLFSTTQPDPRQAKRRLSVLSLYCKKGASHAGV